MQLGRDYPDNKCGNYGYTNKIEESCLAGLEVCMKFKVGLRLKFIVIFIIFCFVISAAVSKFTNTIFKQGIIDKFQKESVSVASYGASLIDGDSIRRYADTLKTDEEYDRTLEKLDDLKNFMDVYYLYVMMPVSNNTVMYIYDAKLTEEQVEDIGDEASTLGATAEYDDVDFQSAKLVMKTGKPSESFDITQTLQGNKYQWLASSYAPIFDSNHKVVAFVGVDVNMTDMNQYMASTGRKMVGIVAGIVLGCMFILLLIIQQSIIKPVRILKRYVEEISEGNFGKQITIRGRDEISEISKVFNRMSKYIQVHINEISVINEAYHKYVPSKIFEILNKTNVTDVRLGNQTNVELSVLSFNIIGFYEMIKKMQSPEMFRFINKVLWNVLPIVIENNGVVENFKDAGFVAFYTERGESSLSAAISICQIMNRLNQSKEFGREEAVKIGIGLTYGPVMLGIVGHDNRMSTISISEQTTMAEYLQSIGEKYYANIIITASAANNIPNFSTVYHTRFLGFLYNVSTGRTEKLYDVFDGDREEDMKMKQQTKDIFEKGVELYCTKHFKEARLEFIKVLRQFRQDKAAREYLYLCNQYYYQENTDEVAVCIEKY